MLRLRKAPIAAADNESNSKRNTTRDERAILWKKTPRARTSAALALRDPLRCRKRPNDAPRCQSNSKRYNNRCERASFSKTRSGASRAYSCFAYGKRRPPRPITKVIANAIQHATSAPSCGKRRRAREPRPPLRFAIRSAVEKDRTTRPGAKVIANAITIAASAPAFQKRAAARLERIHASPTESADHRGR